MFGCYCFSKYTENVETKYKLLEMATEQLHNKRNSQRILAGLDALSGQRDREKKSALVAVAYCLGACILLYIIVAIPHSASPIINVSSNICTYI